MSKTRKRYWIRLVGRCLIFIIGIIMCFISPEKFEVLDGMNFFKSFSEFHLLWICWIVDMVLQIIPIKNEVPLGSQNYLQIVLDQSEKKLTMKLYENMWCQRQWLRTLL